MATLSSLLGSNFAGNPGEITLGATLTVTPDTNPSVSDLTSGDVGLLTAQFSLPRAADLTLGTVTAGSNTTNAEITNTGTNGDSVFNFTIPRGPSVSVGTVSAGSNTTNAAIADVGTNGDSVFNFTIPRGPNVSVGTVTTLAPASSATITDVGTNGDSVFNFGIPKGDPGDILGPVSSTDNAIPRFNGVGGNLLQDSLVTIDDGGNMTANSFSGDGSSLTGIVSTGKAIAMAIVFG